MKNFIVYDMSGKILRVGICNDCDFYLQANDGEFVTEGIADDITQKVTNVGISAKIVDKTIEEIQAEESQSIPETKKPVIIIQSQWQDVLNRISTLENLLAEGDKAVRG